MSRTDLLQLQDTIYRALNARDLGRLHSVAIELAANATQDIPVFHSALNVLGFHDQLPLLNEMMARAWSQLQNDPGYSRPAVEAFAARATDHLIYAFLRESPGASAPSDALIARLENYFPVEAERLQPYLSILSGTKGRPWTMSDFDPLHMSALSGLLVEFLGYAWQRGVPYARAHLVRELMPRYLLDRQAGNLQPKTDMASVLRQTQRPFPETPPAPLHALAPDRPSFFVYLQRLLQTTYPQTHGAAALLALTPYWLDFLVFRELMPAELLPQVKAFLSALHQAIAPYWRDHPDEAIRILTFGAGLS